MATLVLSALGAAAGASVGGGLLGLSSVVIGRAIGAVAGRAVDQMILGAGSDAVEHGKVDRFRVTGASEGAAVTRLFGRMRLGGQVIWASEVAEILTKQHGSLRDDEDEDDNTSLFGVIAAFYWPLLTAVFLAWSFIGDAWDRSWIVWPIGAVLFGAIAAGVGAWESYRKNRR